MWPVRRGALAALLVALLGDGRQVPGPPAPDERAAWRGRERELEARIAALEAELALERERRLAREQEWLEFTRALSWLGGEQAPQPPAFLRAGLGEPAAPVAAGEGGKDGPDGTDGNDGAEEAERRRAEELRTELRANLIAEQVLALDVLEVGRVHAGWVGPVVLRTLDDRGRPTGALAAERLRLEASRSGHALTLVLEEGYERVAGRKIPFGPPSEPGGERGGVRRIHLPGVDPRPWIETFPQLFDGATLHEVPDDGRHDLLALRVAIDALLRAETETGHWRLHDLGGVVGPDLFDVQLAELDRSGNVLRRLLADRMAVRRAGEGLELVLRDGVQVRDGRKAPFLQGLYRVYLPGADPLEWKAAGVPGL